jgi:dTMP kinase
MSAASITMGCFITLEGGEAAGKSTQARLLAAWLNEQGVRTVITREPGGVDGAEEIRQLLLTGQRGRWDALAEALLHYAARRQHVARLILPALEQGLWVICDRFFDSTTAYQGFGQGIDRATLDRIRFVSLGDFQPDLTIVLDIDPDSRQSRIAARSTNMDRYELMDEAFHDRVRDAFLEIARLDPLRCCVIDAASSLSVVADAVRMVVSQRLRSRLAGYVDQGGK